MYRKHQHEGLALLMVASLGIVYGDIGTSPLYALREAIKALSGDASMASVLGILSLIFWTLTIVVTVKYIMLIMRADNHGEGGVFALITLAQKSLHKKYKHFVIVLGFLGASLFFGDGIITPAISVLSALEGLKVISHSFEDFVTPLTILVLALIFWSQSKGTARIAAFFGPIMVVWFVVIGFFGLLAIIKYPSVLIALDPRHAIWFMMANSGISLTVLGAVVLAVTGAEALYADMGHFGKTPIRLSWFVFVYPSLLLNYFGQGALLLYEPIPAFHHPFFHLFPAWGVFPMVILSTIATIIASQALISGIFSVVWQAIQLDFLPKMLVKHTSAEHIGQVYVPSVNWLFFVLIIIVVAIFEDSSGLASAYGFAVTGLMVITTLMTIIVAIQIWEWQKLLVFFVFIPLLLIDLSLFSATSTKILDGAWFPILTTFMGWSLLMTWHKGRETLKSHHKLTNMSFVDLIKLIKREKPTVVEGNAIYMNSSPDRVPSAFLINYKHNKIIHSNIIFLSVITEDVPRISADYRVDVDKIHKNIYRIRATYGFMEIPSLANIFEHLKKIKLNINMDDTTVFLTRGIPFASFHHHMPEWQSRLYIFLAKNAMATTEFFRIPYSRVIELGARWRL